MRDGQCRTFYYYRGDDNIFIIGYKCGFSKKISRVLPGPRKTAVDATATALRPRRRTAVARDGTCCVRTGSSWARRSWRPAGRDIGSAWSTRPTAKKTIAVSWLFHCTRRGAIRRCTVSGRWTAVSSVSADQVRIRDCGQRRVERSAGNSNCCGRVIIIICSPGHAAGQSNVDVCAMEKVGYTAHRAHHPSLDNNNIKLLQNVFYQ